MKRNKAISWLKKAPFSINLQNLANYQEAKGKNNKGYIAICKLLNGIHCKTEPDVIYSILGRPTELFIEWRSKNPNTHQQKVVVSFDEVTALGHVYSFRVTDEDTDKKVGVAFNLNTPDGLQSAIEQVDYFHSKVGVL